jgi:hypothetical protein
MIEPVDDDAFSASAREEPARLVLTFSGNTEIDTKPLLDRFLLQVHEEACRRGIAEVTADLREAAFFNSACLKALARWIITAVTHSRPSYRITFSTTKAHAWQRRSLAALISLAPQAVSIVGDG